MADSKENEYKELFLAEAHEQFEELNRLATILEKHPEDGTTINNIFRIIHTLKGNAMAMGFDQVADLAHTIEDLFGELRKETIVFGPDLAESIFKSFDKLGALIESITSGKRVIYKGIKTKLRVFLERTKGDIQDDASPVNTQKQVASNQESTGLTSDNNLEGTAEVEQSNILEEALEEGTTEAVSEESSASIQFSDTVQIPVRKLDSLLDLVGELIIEKDSLVAQESSRTNSNINAFTRLNRITSDLQYGIMDVRLVQVGFLFNKFHRILRDAAKEEGKSARLVLEGTDIEIDRNVLKVISDSLIHLVRNAVGHGIENAEDRKKLGKNTEGVVKLLARNEKDTVVIEITDDGKGIDTKRIREKIVQKGLVKPEIAKVLSEEEVMMFIFEPGFSNADTITAISGRGVGMDVVKRSVESIGGRVSVRTMANEGTTFKLILPTSMALKSALLFLLDEQEYAIPLVYTESVISLRKRDIHKVGIGLVAKYLNKTIPVVFLRDIFQANSLREIRFKEGSMHRSHALLKDDDRLEAVIVAYGEQYIALIVDKLLQQKEIVEKTLSYPINTIELFSGATILGNGNACLVLDIITITKIFFRDRLEQTVQDDFK